MEIARIIFEKHSHLRSFEKNLIVFQVSRFYDWLTRRREILNSVKDTIKFHDKFVKTKVSSSERNIFIV